jgi:DNA-directed RNA polymerase subunit alpha
MRVGDRTDYNRLRVIIETNGILSPKEALEYSIETMIKQLQAVVGFKETVQSSTILSDDMEEKVDTEVPLTKVKIEELGFSTRTENALITGGVKTLAGLIKKSEDDLKEMGGLGDKAIEEVKELLEGKGLSLKV